MIDRYFAIPLLFSMHVFAADYEVTIDGKTHAFVEGVEQTIQTAAGEIRISVKAPRLKVCKEDGFTFDYPGDMNVEAEDLEGGIRQVTVEAIDSTLQGAIEDQASTEVRFKAVAESLR